MIAAILGTNTDTWVFVLLVFTSVASIITCIISFTDLKRSARLKEDLQRLEEGPP
jgi:hypothetical protein